jgi:predicted aminopeptidase
MKTNRALSAARAREDRQACLDWLLPHMADGKPKAMSKDEYRELARQEFNFATAAFNDAWIWAIEETGRHDWYEGRGRDEA